MWGTLHQVEGTVEFQPWQRQLLCWHLGMNYTFKKFWDSFESRV